MELWTSLELAEDALPRVREQLDRPLDPVWGKDDGEIAELLAGEERLWLAACSNAIASDAEWLEGRAEVRGTIAAGRQEAVAAVAQVLASPSGGDAALELARDRWAPLCVELGTGTPVLPATLLAGVPEPGLRSLLQRLEDLGGDSGATAAVALLAAHLRGLDLVVERRASVAVLFDRNVYGFAGVLTLESLRNGPHGLFPDMRDHWGLEADEEFAEALAAASAWYRQAHPRGPLSVRYRLQVAGLPLHQVGGPSLGAAVAVCLADLRYQHRFPLAPVRVPPLRRIHPGSAVTGAVDTSGDMVGVNGYRHKLAAAHAEGLRTLVPEVDRDEVEVLAHQLDGDIDVGFVSDVEGAHRRLTRTFNPRALGTVAAVLLAVVASLAALSLSATSTEERARADSERARADSESELRQEAEVDRLAAALASRASTLSYTNERLALLLAVESYALRPSDLAVETLADVLGDTSDLVGLLRGHDGSPVDQAFLPEGETLVTGEISGRLLVWDARSGELLAEIPRATGAGQDPRLGVLLAHPHRPWVLTKRGTEVTLWDLSDPSAPTVRVTAHHDGNLVDGAFDPAGHAVALRALEQTTSGGRSFQVLELTVDDLQPLRRVAARELGLRATTISALAYDARGTRLVLAAGTEVAVLQNEPPYDITRVDVGETVTALGFVPSFEPARELLVGTSAGLMRWDLELGQRLQFPTGGIATSVSSITATEGGLAGDTRRVAVEAEGQEDERLRLRILDPDDGYTQVGRTYEPGWSHAGSAGLSLLTTSPGDGTVLVHAPEGEDARRVIMPGRANDVAYLADGRVAMGDRAGRLRVASPDDFTVVAPDWSADDQVRTVEQLDGTIWMVETSPDGRWLLAGGNGRDGWDGFSVYEVEDDFAPVAQDLDLGPSADIRQALFLPDGDVILVDFDGPIHRVRTSDWTVQETVRSVAGSHAAALSPDGTLLVTGHVTWTETTPGHAGTFALWSTQPLASAAPLVRAHERGLTSLAWMPDGSEFLSAGLDGTIGRWKPSGEPADDALQVDEIQITDIAPSPDGTRLATASASTGIQLLTLPGLQPAGPSLRQADAFPWRLGWSPDGARLAAASRVFDENVADGPVTVWTVDEFAWQRAACRRAGGPLTEAEWATYVGDLVPYRPACQELAEAPTSGQHASEDDDREEEAAEPHGREATLRVVDDGIALPVVTGACEDVLENDAWTCGAYGTTLQHAWTASEYEVSGEGPPESTIRLYRRDGDSWLQTHELTEEYAYGEVVTVQIPGGTAAVVSLVMDGAGASGLHRIFEGDEMVHEFSSNRTEVRYDGTGIRATQSEYRSSDALCCATGATSFRIERVDGEWRRREAFSRTWRAHADWARTARNRRFPILRPDGLAGTDLGDSFADAVREVDAVLEQPAERSPLVEGVVRVAGGADEWASLESACWDEGLLCAFGDSDGALTGWTVTPHPLDGAFPGDVDSIWLTTPEGVGLGTIEDEVSDLLGRVTFDQPSPQGWTWDALDWAVGEPRTLVGLRAGTYRTVARTPLELADQDLGAVLGAPALGTARRHWVDEDGGQRRTTVIGGSSRGGFVIRSERAEASTGPQVVRGAWQLPQAASACVTDDGMLLRASRPGPDGSTSVLYRIDDRDGPVLAPDLDPSELTCR